MSKIAVEFKNVFKSFGHVEANKDVSFKANDGSIHAIVGENGAGKSTAVKMLFGMYRPDKGDLLLHGQRVQFKSPVDAMAAGIGMVHQHFMLAETLSALDNILLHQKGSAFSILPRQNQKLHLEKIAERYGFRIPLESLVSELSVGEQQRLEILKILAQDSKILILDEPTAVLTPQETLDLFQNLRMLRDEGKTIIIITHKLKEVMAVTDEVTVFRAGQVVANRKTAATSAEELAELMVGRRLNAIPEKIGPRDESPSVLRLQNVSAQLGNNSIRNINFNVRSGEILGVAGVEGNGQDVLIRTLLDRTTLNPKSLQGEVHTEGKVQSFPEDRLRFGALSQRPVYENLILGRHKEASFSRGIFLRFKQIFAHADEVLKNYDVRPQNIFLNFGALSGGNQQKIVVARALEQNPQLLIAAQPTRGVDIGAIEFIHEQLRKACQKGTGILLISSELDELMTLSDRIVVLFQGKIAGEFQRQDFDEIVLGKLMGCGK